MSSSINHPKITFKPGNEESSAIAYSYEMDPGAAGEKNRLEYFGYPTYHCTLDERVKGLAGRYVYQSVHSSHDGDECGRDNAKEHQVGHFMLTKYRENSPYERFLILSINIYPPFQRQGFGSATTRHALGIAFSNDWVNLVKLNYASWNKGAERMYQKAGFREVGRLVEAYEMVGSKWDRVEMAMSRKEFEQLK